MNAKLLFALPVIGLLSAQLSAQAEVDVAPPQSTQKRWSGISENDVEAYVNRVFSKGNSRRFFRGSGNVYKLEQPIQVTAFFPECESSARTLVETIHENSGIDIRYNGTDRKEGEMIISMLIIGINGIDELKANESLYNMLSKNVFNGDKNIDNEVTNNLHGKYILYGTSSDKKTNYINATVTMFSKDTISDPGCDVTMVAAIFPFVANSGSSYNNTYLVDIDYLFISALYDPSILPGESEDSARPKIVNIMNSKIKGE